MKWINKPQMVALLAASTLMIGVSCSSGQKTNSDSQNQRNGDQMLSDAPSLADTTSPASDSMHSKIAAFKKKWNRNMDDLNDEIANVKKKLKKASAKNKKKLNEKLNDLESKQKELQSEIDSAGDKAAGQWNEFTKDVSDKYQSLKDNVKDFFQHD